jgi:ketosteroid isomerase-like protein
MILSIRRYPISGGATMSDVAGSIDETERRARAFLDALEHKDLDAVESMTDERATLTIPLSSSGNQEPDAHFAGRAEVLGYIRQAFHIMGAIRFTRVRISVTEAGETAFVQANGDFTTADGRPYRNVYVFRQDWREGRIVRAEEYANPVTFTRTFGVTG